VREIAVIEGLSDTGPNMNWLDAGTKAATEGKCVVGETTACDD